MLRTCKVHSIASHFMTIHLFLKTDDLLFAKLFWQLQRNKLETLYKLDPANYLTSTSLAWDTTLLKPSVELDVMTNP